MRIVYSVSGLLSARGQQRELAVSYSAESEQLTGAGKGATQTKAPWHMAATKSKRGIGESRDEEQSANAHGSND